jgi:GrpB-like predicted nucleotidyltransferase (UPF0157 family)
MDDAAIEIVAYDTGWPARFEVEAKILTVLLAPWLAGDIEHIGSTAVPGLAAKPVIDIMLPVHSLEASRPAIAAAAGASYLYAPYRAEVMHWFCKPSPAHRTHHLHMLKAGGSVWSERLAFRDALRSDPRLAAEYAVLKKELALRFSHDREGYTAAKTPFIHRVLNTLR